MCPLKCHTFFVLFYYRSKNSTFWVNFPKLSHFAKVFFVEKSKTIWGHALYTVTLSIRDSNLGPSENNRVWVRLLRRRRTAAGARVWFYFLGNIFWGKFVTNGGAELIILILGKVMVHSLYICLAYKEKPHAACKVSTTCKSSNESTKNKLK